MIALLLALTVVQDSAPGTYSLLACRESCATTDTTDALAKGFVVLGADGEGCFEITRLQAFRSHLAVHRDGYTGWRQNPESDTLVFWTYRGVDASHVVKAVLTNDGFVGKGHSAGAGAASLDVPDEFIVGRRLGPPEMNRCRIYRADRRSNVAAPLLMFLAAVGLGFAMSR